MEKASCTIPQEGRKNIYSPILVANLIIVLLIVLLRPSLRL